MQDEDPKRKTHKSTGVIAAKNKIIVKRQNRRGSEKRI